MTKILLARKLRNQQRLENAKKVSKNRAAQGAGTEMSVKDLSRTDQPSSTKKEEEQQSKNNDGSNTAEKKAANTKRKKKSTSKRKGSGLTPKSIYLHDDVHKQFEMLADDLDYEIGAKGLSSEQLSMLVQFLLDSYQKPKNSSTPLTQEGHYLYRIHQIVKYRSTTMKDTIDEIVDFMTESKYLVPKTFSPKSKYGWTNQIIISLLDKDSLDKEINTLNGKSNTEDSSLTEEELKEPEYRTEDIDVLFTGGIADLKEQIRKSRIIEQMLSGCSSLPENNSDRHETTPKDINRANHLTSLSDKALFRHFSMARHNRVLKADEVFERYGIERNALIKRIREAISNSYPHEET